MGHQISCCCSGQSDVLVVQVCRRWAAVCNTREIWRGCEARLHLRKVSSLVVPSLVRRGIHRVQVLSIRRSLRDRVPGLHTLTSLNLSGCFNLTDPGLAVMMHQLTPSLTHLNLGLCKEVTDRSLARIGRHCPGLTSLDLGGCTGLTDTGLACLSSLPALVQLNLRSCWQLSDTGMATLPPRLTSLDLQVKQ